MTKYCIYKEFPGFIPMMNPNEIKERLKKVDTMPLNLVMKIVDANGKFLEWYEEIYSGKRDVEKGMGMVEIWKQMVVDMNQRFLDGDFDCITIEIQLICLGWVAGEDTYLISL